MSRLSGRRSLVTVLCVAAVLATAVPATAAPITGAAPHPEAVPVDARAEMPEGGVPAGVVAAAVEAAPARGGELLVKAAPRSRGGEQALAKVGARVLRRRGAWTVVAVPRGRERSTAERLAADPAVRAAEPNYLRSASGHASTEVGWGVGVLGAARAWERTPPATGKGVRVAVLDSGVDARHPQLIGRVAPGYDVYGTKGRDDCGHGTAVAGVIAAAHDGDETVGVAPEATIVPVKVLRYEDFYGSCVGDDESIARGIMWAADRTGGRADIINLSLSGPPPSQVLADAVAYATRQGALVVAASGNAGDRVPNYPAAYTDVLSVGGLQQSRGGVRWWPLSTFGSVDIAAPAKAVPVILASRVSAHRLGAHACPAGTGQPLCADGTSFAAPHVAGLAALLVTEHPELSTLGPTERVARLRQWLLGTAVDIAPTADQRGVDLKTGHGRPDAIAALDGSSDAERTLVAWEVGERVLSPTARIIATPARMPASLMITNGLGEPLPGRDVVFRPAAGGTVSSTSGVTDTRGRAPTVFRSTAAGRRTSLTATVGDRTLPLESYVLQHDDNIPGVPLPPSPFRGRLDTSFDVDDVYRVRLKAGETLRVNVSGVDPQREYIDMYLHSGAARDVTNPERAPLREDTVRFEIEPLKLRRTVSADGTRYVHLIGFGSYRVTWWIVSPGKIRNVRVNPSPFTPNGDGVDDTAVVRWRTARAGDVTLRVRNGDGKVVRTVALGRQSRGSYAYRWDGRRASGQLLPGGRYRVTVHWANGRGRVSSDSARVRLRR